ncbi:hypothetical protein [Bacillus badius]|nr:hypothetical protein [Bacillus badius]KIL76773.1 hypothetical protein SD78_0875 [Bacillus badius]
MDCLRSKETAEAAVFGGVLDRLEHFITKGVKIYARKNFYKFFFGKF